MRKTIITTLLLAATITIAAQDGNLALGCHATASTEAGTHTAGKAVDGSTTGDSRWESLFADVTDADDQWWCVDLGAAREFDMIQIVWEGAYARTFRLVAANNADFSDGVTILERDETLSDLTRNYDLPQPVTARYVKFVGVKRALPYGYSFYEFGVYKKAAPVLTTLTATPAEALCRVGSSMAIAVSATDQYGSPIATGEVTFAVSPADAGTFHGNAFIPSRTGVVQITARSGGIVSAAFDVVAFEGNNVASADKVTAYSADADMATIALAFDESEEAGEWILHGNTADSEQERTYDAWFTLDLGKDYILSMVSVCFEGASSSAYTISISDDGETWRDAATVTHPDGINAWKDRIGAFITDVSAVRYVRFRSIRAATQYGVKVREFAVYGRAVDGEITKPRHTDAQTGAWVLSGELNALTASFFSDDNATAYDLRSLAIAAPITIEAQNPNTIFIVTDEQKALLGATPNMVVAMPDGTFHAENIALTDGYDVHTRLTITADYATYQRPAISKLQTLVVPFTVPVPPLLRAYTMVDRTSTGILFQETFAIEAGVPYLISATGGAAPLSLSATDAVLNFECLTERGDETAFTGTFSSMTAGDAGASTYVLDGEGLFRRASAAAPIPAFRAWLTASDTAQAKMTALLGDITGVEAIAPETTATGTGGAYTIGGVKISGKAKGLIISNHRKIIMTAAE